MQQEDNHLKPRIEALGETKPPNTLILEGQKKVGLSNSPYVCTWFMFSQMYPLTYHCYLIQIYVAYLEVGS